jgi:hypothetical protein
LATSSIVISGSDSIALEAARSLATKAQGTTPFFTAGTGRLQAGFGAFADNRAFKLGQGTEHMKDQFPAVGGGVDCFSQ